jgi:hypothetical protein
MSKNTDQAAISNQSHINLTSFVIPQGIIVRSSYLPKKPDVFFLTGVPRWSRKTITAIKTALYLLKRDHNQIIYVCPTIKAIDDVYEKFKKYAQELGLKPTILLKEGIGRNCEWKDRKRMFDIIRKSHTSFREGDMCLFVPFHCKKWEECHTREDPNRADIVITVPELLFDLTFEGKTVVLDEVDQLIDRARQQEYTNRISLHTTLKRLEKERDELQTFINTDKWLQTLNKKTQAPAFPLKRELAEDLKDWCEMVCLIFKNFPKAIDHIESDLTYLLKQESLLEQKHFSKYSKKEYIGLTRRFSGIYKHFRAHYHHGLLCLHIAECIRECMRENDLYEYHSFDKTKRFTDSLHIEKILGSYNRRELVFPKLPHLERLFPLNAKTLILISATEQIEHLRRFVVIPDDHILNLAPERFPKHIHAFNYKPSYHFIRKTSLDILSLCLSEILNVWNAIFPNQFHILVNCKNIKTVKQLNQLKERLFNWCKIVYTPKDLPNPTDRAERFILLNWARSDLSSAVDVDVDLVINLGDPIPNILGANNSINWSKERYGLTYSIPFFTAQALAQEQSRSFGNKKETWIVNAGFDIEEYQGIFDHLDILIDQSITVSQKKQLLPALKVEKERIEEKERCKDPKYLAKKLRNEGKKLKDIAKILSCDIRTVERYLKNK